ncbi:hypothetical protein [Streptomyces sp. 8L]|nr:hypothetical protein [Streptomyces sp. 8L]MCA1223499.1 hypothetical protein [Streptomyces sp. 8L]
MDTTTLKDTQANLDMRQVQEELAKALAYIERLPSQYRRDGSDLVITQH